MSLLEVQNLVAGYDGLTILRGVSLRVEPGQIVAIVGPNGAGKSTLLKTVFGLLQARAGTVCFEAEDVTLLPPQERLRRGLSYVPQGKNVFPLMTVERNLELGAHILADSRAVRRALEEVYTRFAQLRERRHQRASELSGGLLQLLQIARALMLAPRLIMFDEPSLGLSPALVRETFASIAEIAGRGVGVLLVEQNASKALELAHYGYVLDLGSNRYEGSGHALRNDERVRRLYLGGR